MADNVLYPEPAAGPSSKPVATDDVGGIHYQRVKLVDGTDGSTTDVPYGAAGFKVHSAKAGTATLSTVPTDVASSMALAANANRIGVLFFNKSTSACYVKFGATASASDFTFYLLGKGFYEMPYPPYTGRIDVIWEVDDGTDLFVTELT